MEIRVCTLKAVQPRHQPLGRKDRSHRHGEQISVRFLRQANAAREFAEAALEIGQNLGAQRRWNQALGCAGEKRVAQLVLGFQYLLADGALGNTELFRSFGKRSKPSRHFHGAQAVKMNLIEKFHIGFLQPSAAKLHTKSCPEVPNEAGKETGNGLQLVHLKIDKKTAR